MRDYSPFGGKAGCDSTPATNMQLRSKCTAWPLQNQALKMQHCKSASQYESTVQPQKLLTILEEVPLHIWILWVVAVE